MVSEILDKGKKVPNVKCPVCENTIQNNKNYCSYCGWGMMDDLSVYGSLFSNEQTKEYQERVQLYRKFVKNDFKEVTFRTTEEYFDSCMKSKSEIQMVDMAFHAGAEWFSNIEKNDILYELADAGVKLRILLNEPERSELIGKHMRHQRKSYMSFEECIQKWKKFGERYQDQVEVRVIDIPILHRYYSVHMKDSGQDTVNIKYYTYANVKPGKNYQSYFTCDSDFFDLYRDEFQYLWNSVPEPDPELWGKNQEMMDQIRANMLYVKAPNRDWQTIYELKDNGDVIRYESSGGSRVFQNCKTIEMIYFNTPFAVGVRNNGQVVCTGGVENILQDKLESVRFKVKDIVSNYYGTFLLNEDGGVVGINNFPISGIENCDSGFQMGYFKDLPKSGVCRVIARDAELLMLRMDGSITSYSMRNCGFFPRGYCLKNLERIRNINWSSVEFLTGGLFGEEWLLHDKNQPDRILAASSDMLLETVTEIFRQYKKESVRQLELTEDSILAVTNQGELVQKWLAKYPNPDYSVWISTNPDTSARGYKRIDESVLKIHYHNSCLFVETEESIFIPGGIWGPERFASVLRSTKKDGAKRTSRKKKSE